jgi:subtilisin family serine protease
VLVKFRPGTTEDVKGNIFKQINGTVSEHIVTKAMERAGDKEGFYRVQTSLETMQAVGALKNADAVAVAEPNFIYTYGATSNDPYFTGGQLWGMYGAATIPANQYGCEAATAWAAGNTGSSSVVVGVIDEGIMNTHEDLAANCWVNPYETPGDGIDNDGNGYIDDVTGWDFNGNDNTTFDGTGDDHATHVAGTIGAVGGNGKGVAGVNWNVQMISCKFLGSRGGTTANAIKAVDYITDMKTRHGMNIVATNNSWGGGGYSSLLDAAIGRANTADILFVAAAGNNSANNDVTANYPSNYTDANVIAVAAINSAGALSSFSDWGATTVHLGAPGENIYSTLPGSGPRHTIVSTYGSYSGTSMATPHVTGAAALYAATHPGSSAATIKAAILGSTTPTSSLAGKCTTGGRLNVSGF